MTEERFAALADAYGADIGRWPEGEREAARRMAAQAPARAALDREAALDHLLWQAPADAPSLALTDRVIALAPRPRAARAPRARWLAGLGVAAGMACACAAGVGLGAVLTPHALINAVLPAHPAAASEEAAAFDSGLAGEAG